MAAQPDSMRPMLFMAAVLLHGLALYALANVTMMTPAKVIPEVQMQLVRIAVKLPPPPPPPPMASQMQSLLVGAKPLAAAAAPIPIMTSAPSTFKIPLPELNGKGTAQQLSQLLQSTTGPDTSGETPDIGGLKISPNENVGVLYDNSPSMANVVDYVQITISHFFPMANTLPCDGCAGTYLPKDEINDQTQHDFYYQGDAVAAAPSGKANKPITALVMVSDWEDGAEDRATDAFVAGLRSRHIKLFLLSVERVPYKGLVEYAKESGGQASITTEAALLAPPDPNTLK